MTFVKWMTAVGVFSLIMGLGCFTADEEPPDEDSGELPDDDTLDDDVDDDSGDDGGDDAEDDDAAVDDDADDDSDDDADDDTDDDADDDQWDDDTAAPVAACEEITGVVYTYCQDAFAPRSSPGERLSEEDALAACVPDDSGAYWLCVQECVDEHVDDCDGLDGCVDGCGGELYYENLA